jgi:HPt (histidine-containing phosphotransfer) domain-containing protein
MNDQLGNPLAKIETKAFKGGVASGPEQLRKLYRAYLADGKVALHQMRYAFGDSDLDGVKKLAEYLKGSSAALGVASVAGACNDLASAAAVGSSDGCDTALETLGVVFSKTEREMRETIFAVRR